MTRQGRSRSHRRCPRVHADECDERTLECRGVASRLRRPPTGLEYAVAGPMHGDRPDSGAEPPRRSAKSARELRETAGSMPVALIPDWLAGWVEVRAQLEPHDSCICRGFDERYFVEFCLSLETRESCLRPAHQ